MCELQVFLLQRLEVRMSEDARDLDNIKTSAWK